MNREVRCRLALLAGGLVVFAVAALVRLHALQVGQGDELRDRARRQHKQTIEVVGRRGGILDRHGRELAISLETFSLFAHPARVQDPARAARLLAPLLDLPERRVLERLRSRAPFVWLRRRLDPERAEAIRALDLPIGEGEPFGFEIEGRRVYPRGGLGVHVVGFADIDQRGIEGIERAYDEQLQAARVRYLAVRDGRGRAVLERLRGDEREARDVVLTLDLVIQHAVERELDRAMRETGARSASAVFLDPATGDVLALANRPSVDPNLYGSAQPGARRNRAVTDLYEPGSTFKIVTTAAALDRRTVSPEQLFDCQGGTIVIAGHAIRDHERFGVLTLRGVVEHSSNVGIIKVARTLPPEAFRRAIARFGFGARTGIELPGEARGTLAPVARWSKLSQASLAMGYEIAVTPLQLATAIAVIANDGVRVAPRIVLGTRGDDGALRSEPRPGPVQVVERRTARTLASILEGVVENGTGRAAWIAGYRIAGKTGTARKVLAGGGYSRQDRIASFAGFAPARAPRIAGIVVLDSPVGHRYYGGQVAAPAFARIVSDALAALRVPPDEDPLVDEPHDRLLLAQEAPAAPSAPPAERRPEPAIERVVTGPGQMPDVRGLPLRRAVATLAGAGCRVRVRGSGEVAAQIPAPGTPLPSPAACTIVLGELAAASVP